MLAANNSQPILDISAKATELKKRIWFTLGALIVYPASAPIVPLPGVNPVAFAGLLRQTASGGILGHLQHVLGRRRRADEPSSRWASCRTSRPRSSCSSLASVVPSLGAAEEGRREAAARSFNQYTRYGTVLPGCCVRSCRHRRRTLESAQAAASTIRACSSGSSTVITLVGGTMFLMWLGEQITRAASATASR